jgi:hypothetical protein
MKDAVPSVSVYITEPLVLDDRYVWGVRLGSLRREERGVRVCWAVQ